MLHCGRYYSVCGTVKSGSWDRGRPARIEREARTITVALTLRRAIPILRHLR
jgi:hypothetical protein